MWQTLFQGLTIQQGTNTYIENIWSTFIILLIIQQAHSLTVHKIVEVHRWQHILCPWNAQSLTGTHIEKNGEVQKNEGHKDEAVKPEEE